MTKRLTFALALSPLALIAASCGANAGGDSGQATSTPTPSDPVVMSGRDLASEDFGTFAEPWAAAFAPGTTTLFITEKAGTIRFVDTATRRMGTVSGAPEVDYGGQGGLGDIAFLPSESSATLGRRTIYLTWAEAGEGDTRGAALGRGTLVCGDADACAIEGLRVIWRQPKVTGRGHYGHRIAVSPDGKHLYVSSSDRQKMDPAQDTANNIGSIVRLNLDGTPAAGNALSGQSGKAQDVWSWGHRNILGMDFDAQGRLWEIEHGPAGGDELNLVERGANYGWPVVSEGDHYDGRDIPPHSTRPEFRAPALSWNPVIAPGDFIFYRGDMFAEWKGQAIIAAMDPTAIVRVAIEGNRAREVARIPFEKRLREIVEAPDGAIWVLEDKAGGRLLRLTPG
jgi:glucose/arabinose dehydrogenase